jgi:hypothetical protein
VEPVGRSVCSTVVRIAYVAAGLFVTVGLAACSSTAPVAERRPPRAPSADPYTASLAYARCLRQHGVPHPDPDKRGDFNLTPAQERRIRQVAPKRREIAMKACFHNLEALDMQPLSSRAKARALEVLLRLRRCMRGYGYELGDPVVQNKSFGRAFFGFENAPAAPPTSRRRHAQRACEKRVDMARKISKIIAEDRRTHHAGGL